MIPAAEPGEAGRYVGTELELFAEARHWKSYWARGLRPLLRGRVLDVGAGNGATARLFADHPDITEYLALEPDPELARQMREAGGAGLPPRFHVLNGTTRDLAPDQRFDTILYIDVLEHIAADREELARATGLLAPGGRILVLSPAHGFLYSAFDAAIGHERRYDRASLRAALPEGLVAERLYYLDSVGLLASLGNRWLLRRSRPNPRLIALWDGWMVPASRLLDPLLLHRVGKSIVAVLRGSAP